MNELNKKMVMPHFFRIALLLSLLASEFQVSKASTELNKQELCIAKGVKPSSQQCADLIKQSQLGVVRLSPQIREVDIKKDHGINLIEFYPFVGGSADGKVE